MLAFALLEAIHHEILEARERRAKALDAVKNAQQLPAL
jgi:hypothetical protein